MEFIVCSAICDTDSIDKIIYCGLRHHNIFSQGKHISRKLKHQGFLTSTGRFVSRTEGAEIALACGQCTKLIRVDKLDSSDLYQYKFKN